MYKLAISSAVISVCFILWIIYLANTGSSSVFFDLVHTTPYGDKIGHFFLFGILTLTFNLATKFRTLRIVNLNIYYGTLIVSIFVLLEELSQGFIPSRTLDIRDLAADTLGIATFSCLSALINRRLTGWPGDSN